MLKQQKTSFDNFTHRQQKIKSPTMHMEPQGICKKSCHTVRFSTADPTRIIPKLNPGLGSDIDSSDIDILAWLAL